jgi:hypothetical protein
MQATLTFLQHFGTADDRASLRALCSAWFVALSARARRRFAVTRIEDATGLDAHMRRDIGMVV